MKKYLMGVFMFMFVLILTACSDGGDTRGIPELAPLPVNKNQPIECDWALHVDDTIYEKREGVTVKHNLIVDAYKQGGKDDMGVYVGTARLSSEADLGALTNDAFAVSGKTGGAGSDNKARIDVVKYDVNKYSTGLELVPLVPYDAMALGTFNLKGNGYINMNMVGIDGTKGNGEEQFASAVPVQFKMLIKGGQVSIDIPSLNTAKEFKGMITGTPKK